MKSFDCLLFGILGTSFLLSSNFNCIDGQVVNAKQLSSPYYFQTGAGTPLPYAYNSDVTTTPVLSPQRDPSSTFAYQYGAGTGTGTGTGVSPLPVSMAQYQWYPSEYQFQNKYQQLYQYPLRYTSSGVTDANGYPVWGAVPVPVQKEVLLELEQPFISPSFVSSGPIQGYYGNGYANNAGFLETTSPAPPPMVNILEANFPIRTEVDSPAGHHQGNLLPQRVPIPVSVPTAHPDHLPVHVLKVQEEGEEGAVEIEGFQQQHSYDEVLASLMAEAQKNGQTVHSDRYTYGRSQPLPYRYRYQLVPVAVPNKLNQYRNRQRGLVKTSIQGDELQHVIKKPFQVQRPHHFEFYDWH